ncbi:hypothetical protein BJ742DRAFT_806783 [Cladochytrium replicatum]|nr:hypothetical protein BJ742DRAFT_806783 [Cladochytrium replicatum]
MATRCSSLWQGMRAFATSAKLNARKRSPLANSTPDSQYPTLSGNTARDGLNRYQLDFVETAEWVKNMLLKLKTDAPLLKAQHHLNARETESQIPVICLESSEKFTYDFTQPPPTSTSARLHVRVANLTELDAAQSHKFRLLTGNLYNPRNDTVVFDSDKGDLNASKKEVFRMFLDSLKESQTGDALTDIPLDVGHVRPTVAGLEFPKQWLQTPPVSRKDIGGRFLKAEPAPPALDPTPAHAEATNIQST